MQQKTPDQPPLGGQYANPVSQIVSVLSWWLNLCCLVLVGPNQAALRTCNQLRHGRQRVLKSLKRLFLLRTLMREHGTFISIVSQALQGVWFECSHLSHSTPGRAAARHNTDCIYRALANSILRQLFTYGHRVGRGLSAHSSPASSGPDSTEFRIVLPATGGARIICIPSPASRASQATTSQPAYPAKPFQPAMPRQPSPTQEGQFGTAGQPAFVSSQASPASPASPANPAQSCPAMPRQLSPAKVQPTKLAQVAKPASQLIQRSQPSPACWAGWLSRGGLSADYLLRG